jgi:FMN-dependent NADH-azoreductase
MPHIDCEFSLGPRELGAGDFEHGTFRLSDELIEELEESNAVVLATPMHNLSVPSVLKAWVDHVVRSHRTYRYSDDRTVGLLKDRPVFAVISSGGSFRDGEHPEFLRNYVRAIFGIMGIKSIEFFVLDHMQSGKLNSILPAAEALSILSNAAPAITHERVHALWSQFH